VKHPRLAAALVAAVSLPALAACTDNSSSAADGADAGDGRTITVVSDDDSCELSADEAPSTR
jgi:iron uptake system component EfeO